MSLLLSTLLPTETVGPFPVSGPFPAVTRQFAAVVLALVVRKKIVRFVVTGRFLEPLGLEVVCVLDISPMIEFRGAVTFVNLGLVWGTSIALLLSEETISAILRELVITSGL